METRLSSLMIFNRWYK